MKKTILTALCATAAVGAFAQGTVVFSNLSGLSPAQPIFDADGTTKLNNTFEAQLLESSTAGGPYTAVGSPVAFTGSTGYVIGGQVALTGVAAGATEFLEVAAWNTSAGSSYAAASQVPGAHVGVSGDFSVATGGVGSPPSPPSSLTGLKSFSLTIVPNIPEPSTIALGALGLGALMLRRRK